MAETKIKMDKTIILSSVVGFLGLLSAILGFAGAAAPSPGLWISAGIFLLIAQITVTVVGGCCGCCGSRAFPSKTKRIVGIVCTVGSWITAVIACALFFLGGYSESAGMLAGAAVVILIATALNITSVIMMQLGRQPPPADPEVAAPDHTHTPFVVQTKPRNTPMIPVAVWQTTQNTTSSRSGPLLQTNGQVPQIPQSPPPPTAAPESRQWNLTNPQNQQFSPKGRSSLDTAQPSLSEAHAPNEPVDQSATRSVMMSEPQVPQHQQTTHAPLQANATPPQHTVHQAPVQAVHVAGVPGTPSSSTASSSGNTLAMATISLSKKAIEHALFSNNTASTAPTTWGRGYHSSLDD